MSIAIENAALDDIPEIENLFKAVVSNLISKGIFQWSENYPNLEIITRDISLGNLYMLMHDGRLAGVISRSFDTHPLFSTISWAPGSYVYASRLAILPEYEGRGFGTILMDFIETDSRNNNIGHVRLGAYKPNGRLVNYYLRRGYEIKGELVFPVSTKPFYCMEKQLLAHLT